MLFRCVFVAWILQTHSNLVTEINDATHYKYGFENKTNEKKNR